MSYCVCRTKESQKISKKKSFYLFLVRRLEDIHKFMFLKDIKVDNMMQRFALIGRVLLNFDRTHSYTYFPKLTKYLTLCNTDGYFHHLGHKLVTNNNEKQDHNDVKYFLNLAVIDLQVAIRGFVHEGIVFLLNRRRILFHFFFSL